MNNKFEVIYKITSPKVADPLRWGDSNSVSLGLCPGSEVSTKQDVIGKITKKMKNKPNFNHRHTQYDIRNTSVFMQNEPNSTNPGYKLKAPPKSQTRYGGAAQLNNQLSLINIGAKRKSAYGGINGKTNPITILQIENWK